MTRINRIKCDGVGCDKETDWMDRKWWHLEERGPDREEHTKHLHFCSKDCRKTGILKHMGLAEVRFEPVSQISGSPYRSS